MKVISFKSDKSGISIRIPRTLLNHVAKSNPEFPVKVKDSQALIQKVAFHLEHNLGESESGLTGFEELIDKAIEEVVDSGDECVEEIDLDS